MNIDPKSKKQKSWCKRHKKIRFPAGTEKAENQNTFPAL